MLDFDETPHQQTLSDGFLLRTAANATDVERVAQFNGLIHGHGIVAMTRNLFLHHPDTTGRDLIFVEEPQNGDVVSSLCVIPWNLSYEGVAIKSGEMGIVGTHKDFRNRGLIRSQVEFYKQRLHERGCVMSHIQGIGYYYRQFGYEYAMPLEGGYVITARELPSVTVPEFTFRLASQSADDVADLIAFANQASQSLSIHTLRHRSIWDYLMTYSQGTEMEAETWIIENTSGKVVAYVRLPRFHFGEELTVNEASNMGFSEAVSLLHFLTALAVERKTPGVRLCLPASHGLMRVAKSFNARDNGTYAWQVHIPNIASLLRAIMPALERRARTSMFAELTRDLHLHFYRQSVILRFVAGRLSEVVELAGAMNESSPNHFPPNAFTPLVLGYRSLAETLSAYSDAGVAVSDRLLIETLFPRIQSFLYTIY